MQNVKVFEFDLETVASKDIETTLNNYIDDLKKSNPAVKYDMFSMGYLKIWRIVIYF